MLRLHISVKQNQNNSANIKTDEYLHLLKYYPYLQYVHCLVVLLNMVAYAQIIQWMSLDAEHLVTATMNVSQCKNFECYTIEYYTNVYVGHHTKCVANLKLDGMKLNTQCM